MKGVVKSCWADGETPRRCKCKGGPVPVNTNGWNRWAACGKCGLIWDLKSKENKKKPTP